MGDYLRNTLFVEDLLEFLFSLEGIEWKAKQGVHDFKHELGKSPFDPVIGKAVDKLCEIFHKELEESYDILLEKGIKDEAAFSKYALIEANECFTRGYTHELFLAYCVQILGIPGVHYYRSSSYILDSAAQIVVFVLFSHQMTGEFYRLGGWSGLIGVARKLDDRLPNVDDSDEKKMDDSLGAVLFAEDLMRYIFDKCDLVYVPRVSYKVEKLHAPIGRSPFRAVIGNAICARIEEDLDKLSIIFQQEFKILLDTESVTGHIMRIAARLFKEGYDPASFVEFCTAVSSISISYHEVGQHDTSCFASEVIAAVLTEHIKIGDFNAKGGWTELIRVCTRINNSARTKYL